MFSLYISLSKHWVLQHALHCNHPVAWCTWFNMQQFFTNRTSSVWLPAYPQVNQYQHGAGGMPLFQPLQYSSVPPHPPPSVEPSSPPQPPGFLSEYTQPVQSQPISSVYPGQPPINQCLSSSPPSQPLFFPSSSSYSTPPSSGVSFQHGGPGSPVSYMPPPPSGVSGTKIDNKLIPASQRTGLHASNHPHCHCAPYKFSQPLKLVGF